MLINSYRFGIPWTPLQITTALWLDAADAATVTTVSGAVSQWNDKSGNARHATQGTAGNRPSYSNNTITFDGVNDFLALASAYGSTSQLALSFFAVSAAPGNFMILGTADVTNWTFRGAVIQIRLGNGVSNNVANWNITSSSSSIVSAVHSSTTFSTWANGTATTGSTLANGAINYGGTQYLARGDGGAGTTVYNGSINEIVITSSALSTADRQQMEGYLAHKWNLNANLPSGHPYRSIAPTI
jgi:hypothetical protein